MCEVSVGRGLQKPHRDEEERRAPPSQERKPKWFTGSGEAGRPSLLEGSMPSVRPPAKGLHTLTPWPYTLQPPDCHCLHCWG